MSETPWIVGQKFTVGSLDKPVKRVMGFVREDMDEVYSTVGEAKYKYFGQIYVMFQKDKGVIKLERTKIK